MDFDKLFRELHNLDNPSLSDSERIELAKKHLLGSNLFGTILSDAYTIRETKEIRASLKKLCGSTLKKPFDQYGIYTYWNFQTKEILYIGLTKNLIDRFNQHNGSKSTKGNKQSKIGEYFKANEKLGFSVILQPPLIQQTIFNLFDKDSEIKLMEGALFQTFFNECGRLPLWNIAEGSKQGRKNSFVKRYGDILYMLNLSEEGYLNANSTLRELAFNVEYQEFECDLNLIRAHMYQWKEPFDKVVEILQAYNNMLISQGNQMAIISNLRINRLLNHSYLNKDRKSL